jgi:hypothetical protein
LLEQQVTQAERQHRAETVSDQLESFEQGHDGTTAERLNLFAARTTKHESVSRAIVR